MGAVKLPRSMEELNQIKRLKLNKQVYTVPWAMRVLSDRSCFLDGEYPFEEVPGGAVEMRIERLVEGFRVWSVPGFEYRPGDVWQDTYLPVVDIKERVNG